MVQENTIVIRAFSRQMQSMFATPLRYLPLSDSFAPPDGTSITSGPRSSGVCRRSTLKMLQKMPTPAAAKLNLAAYWGMKSMASRLDTSRVDRTTLRRARSSANDFARAPMAFGK
jgi:hypothetical protein